MGWSQTDPTPKKKKFQLTVHPDTLYVRDYSDFLSVDLPLATSYLNVDLTDKKTTKVLNFKPHSDMTAGVDLGYKVLGLGYAASPRIPVSFSTRSISDSVTYRSMIISAIFPFPEQSSFCS